MLRSGNDLDALSGRNVVGDPVQSQVSIERSGSVILAEDLSKNALGSVGLVVHKEQLDVTDVADEEGLVAGGHHVLGLLVGTIADLKLSLLLALSVSLRPSSAVSFPPSPLLLRNPAHCLPR